MSDFLDLGPIMVMMVLLMGLFGLSAFSTWTQMQNCVERAERLGFHDTQFEGSGWFTSPECWAIDENNRPVRLS